MSERQYDDHGRSHSLPVKPVQHSQITPDQSSEVHAIGVGVDVP